MEIVKVNGNSLLFEISFTTSDSAGCYIVYSDTASGKKLFSLRTANNVHHHIRINNMVENTIYNCRIIAKSDNKTLESRDFNVKTDTLPSVLPEVKLEMNDYQFPGYILLKKFYNPGALYMINGKGQIVWYQAYDTAVLRAFDYTPSGHILSLVDSFVYEDTDMLGKFYNRVDLAKTGLNQKLHHELFENAEGNIVGLTYDKRQVDLSKRGGSRKDSVQCDGILVLDRQGAKIWEWSLFDALDPRTDPYLPEQRADWGHANSIAYDIDGNFLVSIRDFNQVWKINSQTREVMWKLGQNGDAFVKGTEPFIKQHNAHITPAGEMLMFDNGNDQRGYSRILSLKYDSIGNVWRPSINFMLSHDMTTYRMGSAMMIDENHILVCSPKKLMTLAVFDRSGNMVWKVTSNFDSYRAIYLHPEEIENIQWF